MDFEKLTNIAIEAALAAGKIIRARMGDDVLVEQKIGQTSLAAQVVTEVDKACETLILSQLLPTCEEFDLAILSEESEDDQSRFSKDFFWCIDPMDGTIAFIEKRPGFSVAIALVAKDGTPQIGVVYDPINDTLYHASKGNGVYRNKVSWQIENTNAHLSYVTDRKLADTPHKDKIQSLLNQQVESLGLNGIQEIDGGGSVINAIHVLENGPGCMLKLPKEEPGGGSLWDFAATACIFQELGLPATNYDGGKLDLNKQEDTYMNHEGVLYANLNRHES